MIVEYALRSLSLRVRSEILNSVQLLRENFQNIKVLYVEDEQEVRTMTSDLLSKIFNHVDSAENGIDGLKLFKQNDYGLVISDLKMPKMDGYEMLEKISEIDKEVALIVMSAINSMEETRDLVCDAFLNKPVRLMEFIEQLESLQSKILK